MYTSLAVAWFTVCGSILVKSELSLIKKYKIQNLKYKIQKIKNTKYKIENTKYKISLKIGSLPVAMIIDSGARCMYLIGRNAWEYLKANKV